MTKIKIFFIIIRVLLVLIALGLGIWYLSSSISGASLTYTSMDSFLTAAGVEDGDISSANGCFMCRYIADLFYVIGDAAQRFWGLMVDHIWILMVIGFGIFMLIHTVRYIFDNAKKTINYEKPTKHKFEFKAWFDKVWKLGVRVLVAGALMGVLGLGGTTALKTVSNVTITPVLYIGAQMGVVASGVADAAQCGALTATTTGDAADILNPIMQPFMCVMGNINAIMLAGASGGFSMMNYAWMGLGGGAFTWLAGLALVIMFLVIGFDLFFQILTVVFKLVFIIVFLPLLLAAAAFEEVWSNAKGLMTNALNMLLGSAVRLIAITLKVLVIFGTVSYAADMNFPGPVDGYTSVLPPMMGVQADNPDAQTLAVMNVFKTCERAGLEDGEMDKDKFKECFIEEKVAVESRYPGAFDFLSDGWDFLLTMIFLFFLYYYAVSPKIDQLLPAGTIKLPIPFKEDAKNEQPVDLSTDKEVFDYGGQLHHLGQRAARLPKQITDKVIKAIEEQKDSK